MKVIERRNDERQQCGVWSVERVDAVDERARTAMQQPAAAAAAESASHNTKRLLPYIVAESLDGRTPPPAGCSNHQRSAPLQLSSSSSG